MAGPSPEHPAHAAGRKQDGLCAKGVDLAREDLVADDPAHHPTFDQQIKHVVFVEKLYVVAHALLVKGLKDHVPRPVGGIAGAMHRPFAKMMGVPAKGALGDLAVLGAIEGEAPVLQLIDGLNRLLG
jgi:hypothetical protein